MLLYLNCQPLLSIRGWLALPHCRIFSTHCLMMTTAWLAGVIPHQLSSAHYYKRRLSWNLTTLPPMRLTEVRFGNILELIQIILVR